MRRARRRALDGAVDDHAAGDGADLADLEDLTDLGLAERLLDLRGGEQAFHGLADVVDGVVDDVVEADLDPLALGEARRLAGRAHVEADDDRLRRDGEVDVALGDGADARVDDGDPHLVGRELGERVGHGLDRALHVGLDDQRSSS